MTTGIGTFRTDRAHLVSHIGSTPLFWLDSAETGGARVGIKLEGNNPGGSVKDRAAWGMLRRLESEGRLNGDTVIVEPTSGNTGIALAMLGAALGIKVVLTMPESMSLERRAALALYGAELVLSPASEGMAGAVRRAEEVARERPGSVIPDQFSNPGNPWAHRVTTGPEIITALRGVAPAAFVAGVGTGGTVSGTGRALRAAFPDVRVVAVEPAESPLLTEGKAGPHEIQGIGANFVPDNLDRELLTRVDAVPSSAAREEALRLAARYGLSSGISTGANVHAARRIAETLPPEALVVTIQCDRGDRYLSVLGEPRP
jgi:cysteine synthase A